MSKKNSSCQNILLATLHLHKKCQLKERNREVVVVAYEHIVSYTEYVSIFFTGGNCRINLVKADRQTA